MDLGRQEMGAKNFNTAVTYFQRAIVANPKLPIGYVNLAKAEVARARPDLAAKYFAIALELDPIHRDALFGDGMLAISQKANDRAMARLQRLEIACVGCPETEKLKAAIPAP
jgi:tetratricopeptide (TPR) repeat protein